ncbi:disintegrin [Thecamonas trahens ATCC 50062]|uniref:Disintegrin n=1 Tax=Thecamonas trahens ATCC 50062 TaxID=461836 RepID=A0A0L0D809_THETB|nr:disintegrin [Thecamonas trahens ATCC 50062]KNC47443.1 disintegrin [Thecamonas trahens ATCC 50062]|eukprot:XP_013759380.1 disintegrin [Thecamonas trahens ATCC 50062]
MVAVATADVLPLFPAATKVADHDTSSPHHDAHPVAARFADPSQLPRTVHKVHVHPDMRNTNLLLHEIPVLEVLSAEVAPELGPVYGRAVSVSHSDDGSELMIIGRVVDSPDAPLTAEDRLAGSPSHFASGGRFSLHITNSGEHVFGELSLFDHDTAFRWETQADGVDGHVLLRRIHIDEHICRETALAAEDPNDDYDPARDTIATRVLNPPLHNSKPGSPYVIFLDFDGHDASGSAWGSIVAGPYDIDSNTNSFSSTELARISQIWELMAEDYAPFEITVTTNVAVYNAVSESRRVRCVFTITDAWYRTPAASPTSARLGSGNAMFCGEAGSHEVGHNMGLSHDGTSSAGYYTGHGSGITGWAPIMGVGYYQDLVQWSRGEYADASQQQDDLAIVGGSSNGFGFRADDHSNSRTSGTTLNDGSTPAGSGFISTRTDVDYFKITIGSSGSMTFTVEPASANYYNLDIEARLYAGSSLVSTVNPASDVKAVVTYSGVAGTTYYLRVDGVGKGSPTGTGYTDYGSLGEYRILYSGPPSGSGASCGNSIVEAGEQCDPPSQACCTSACQFRPSSYTCRSAVGVCDVAETCTGSSAGCPANAVATAGTTCRASTGPCDVAETCNGVSTSCPANGFRPSSYTCRASAGVCDVAETCTGSSASCPANGFRSNSVVCRASTGVCDVAETCTGSSASCPANSFRSSSYVCRASTGVCDVAETCTGSSASCPANSFRSSSYVCRASTGVCDVAETCTGSSASCPANSFRSSSYVCRASTGVCDVAETCTGSSASCPANSFRSSSYVCRASTGVCDVAETCTGSSASCPANSFRPSSQVCRASAGTCDVAETCSGSSASCPADGFAPAGTSCNDGDVCSSPDTCDGPEHALAGEQCDDGNLVNGDCCSSTCELESSSTVCRPAAGPCDVAETCTGSSPTCPTDSLALSATVCRPSVGACDLAETCTGSSAACPVDSFRPSSFTCRASAGVCDVAETCTGSSAACPADSFQPNSVVCRASAGLCDVAETCTGGSASCPVDSFRSSATVCRASGGPCDVVETCPGNSASCPADGFRPSSHVCRPTAGGCDVAETCPGNAAACPADGFRPSSYVCRAAAGPCDNAETCPGNSAACPADGFKSSATVCRPVAGVCDVEERCTGSSGACPANARRAGEVCRSAAGNLCDQPEVCSASSDDCPADTFLPPGTSCDNGFACDGTSDTCDGSGPNACVGSNPAGCLFTCGDGILEAGEQCDDGNTDNGDCCSSGCQFEPTTQVCSTPTCNGLCDGGGTCTTQPFCCLTDAQCDDGLDCTIDTCGGDEVCHNDPAPAGTSCDDQQDCTINDACNGIDAVCEGENSCPGGCGLNGLCCHSVCECTFGWDSDPSCSIGPDPLNLGFALSHALESTREGRAYSLVVQGGVDIVVSVRPTRGANGASTRATSDVFLYGSFSEIPAKAEGLVIHEYRSEAPELEEQSFVINSTRSGLLFISVFRAPGVASVDFEVVARDINTGRAAPSSPISIANAKDKPWLLIAVGTGLAACCLLTVAIATVWRRRSNKRAAMNFGTYDDTSTIAGNDMEFELATPGPVGFAAITADSPPAPVRPAEGETWEAIYAFAGRESDELSFTVGDRLLVKEQYDDGWGSGNMIATGATGIFPMSYLKKIANETTTARPAPVPRR